MGEAGGGGGGGGGGGVMGRGPGGCDKNCVIDIRQYPADIHSISEKSTQIVH